MQTIECNCGAITEDDDDRIIHFEDCALIQDQLGLYWL